MRRLTGRRHEQRSGWEGQAWVGCEGHAFLGPANSHRPHSIAFHNHRAGKQIVTPDGSEWSPSVRIDSALVQAIVRAHRWRELLETGQHGTAADLAKAEKVNDSYVSRYCD
jgi:hypothetical protein